MSGSAMSHARSSAFNRATICFPVVCLARALQYLTSCPDSGQGVLAFANRPSPLFGQVICVVRALRIRPLLMLVFSSLERLSELGEGVASPWTHGVGLLQIHLGILTVF